MGFVPLIRRSPIPVNQKFVKFISFAYLKSEKLCYILILCVQLTETSLEINFIVVIREITGVSINIVFSIFLVEFLFDGYLIC